MENILDSYGTLSTDYNIDRRHTKSGFLLWNTKECILSMLTVFKDFKYNLFYTRYYTIFYRIPQKAIFSYRRYFKDLCIPTET